MRSVLRFAALAVVPVLLDCASLPPLENGTCGNGVVENNEDCDSFPAAQCLPPGNANACRLDCSQAGASCPSGWGCGADGLCRSPTGTFGKGGDPVAAGAWRLDLGDFDGDKRRDVLTRGVPQSAGGSKLRLHFFDASYALQKAIVIPVSLASASVIDLDGDGKQDITFNTSSGIGAMLGQSDRTLSPVPYPSESFTGATARYVPVKGFPGKRIARAAILADAAHAGVFDVTDLANPLLILPAGPDALAGDLAIANVIDKDSPCDELVLAYVGATKVQVFPVCKGSGNATIWNKGGSTIDVGLPAGVKVDAYGARAADIDGDGHLDILIGGISGAGPQTREQSFIAYGDGAGNFRSRPLSDPGGVAGTAGMFQIPTASLGETYSPLLPLAIGDVSGDGQPDFVTADQVLTSKTTGGGDAGAASTIWYSAQSKNGTHGLWSQAAIADFNGNGFPDVIAATKDALDLELFSGTGTPWMNAFSIPTQGVPKHFSEGDVDGDLLPDLVFADSSSGASGDQLAIVFGQVGGAPPPPTEVGHFQQIEQTTYFVADDAQQRPIGVLGTISQPVGAKNQLVTEVAELFATGDREPLALRSLTDGPLSGSPTLASVPGRFTGATTADVAAVAYDANSGGTKLNAWLLSGNELGNSAATPPLPTNLNPFFQGGGSAGLALLLAHADFSQSGSDELALIAADAVSDASKSVLVVARGKARAGGATALDIRAQIAIDLPTSQEGQLAAADVDADGWVDLVLLTGNNLGPRSIVVLWNDGGAFDASRSTTVSAPASATEEPPQGFGFVNVAVNEKPSIAFVTRSSLFVAHVGDGRTFRRERVQGLRGAGGTGVAGGDVNGDGVDDLVVADSGNVVIFPGKAVHP